MKNFLYAISILIGTIIGVGVFGIPYVAAQAGFSITLIYLIGLGAVTLCIHLFYAEIVLKTPGKHRLVGYAEKYLGKWGKYLASFSNIPEYWAALLVYIIVGGQFLKALLQGSSFNWTLIFFLFGALLIFLGLKMIAQAELLMSLLLLAAMVIIFVFGFSQVHWQNLTGFDWSFLFLPYGVVLFALSGVAAIPEMSELVKGKQLKMAVVLGTLIPAILFIIFVAVVLGVTGPDTTQEALVGLQSILGTKVMLVGLIFGVLALMTSFLTIGLNLKKIFCYDYKTNKNLAWILVCFVPLLAYLFGLRNFIEIIGLIGAILGGINGLIIALIYAKLKKSWFLPGIIILVFLIGIFYQLKILF